MKKLYEILGLKKVDGDFGIEIEVEGENLKPLDNDVWTTTKDGSLRGESYEYVMAKPVKLEEVKPALEQLAKRLEKSTLNFSFRTSVHVHMNVQSLTHPQILNTIFTYLILEEALMNYCGKSRKGNRFCLRLQDAEGLLETLQPLFSEGERGYGQIRADRIRYAAMNVGAMTKYGSLEFRAMRGNMEVDTILTWVKALNNIREFAKAQENPCKVYDMYAELSPLGFLQHVLGNVADKFLQRRLEQDIARSFSLCLDLPHAFHAAEKRRAAGKNVEGGVDWGNWKEVSERIRQHYEATLDGVPLELENNLEEQDDEDEDEIPAVPEVARRIFQPQPIPAQPIRGAWVDEVVIAPKPARRPVRR